MNTHTDPPDATAEYLRPKDAARLFGIPPRTLQKLIMKGPILSHLVTMPGYRTGKMRLINVASLRGFIQGQTAGGAR